MVAFPDAKVILTVRDPETWYESVKNSIYKTYGAHTYFPMNLFAWIMGIYKSLTISNRLSMEPARGAKKGTYISCEIAIISDLIQKYNIFSRFI